MVVVVVEEMVVPASVVMVSSCPARARAVTALVRLLNSAEGLVSGLLTGMFEGDC